MIECVWYKYDMILFECEVQRPTSEKSPTRFLLMPTIYYRITLIASRQPWIIYLLSQLNTTCARICTINRTLFQNVEILFIFGTECYIFELKSGTLAIAMITIKFNTRLSLLGTIWISVLYIICKIFTSLKLLDT